MKNNKRIELLLGVIDNLEDTQEALNNTKVGNDRARSFIASADGKFDDAIYFINEAIAELEEEKE